MLNVMVLESERGAADEAAHELRAAGHVVLRCHDAHAPVFPCRGLVDESTCPLRSHPVDVAVTVRSEVSSRPTASEDGARCALMDHVPLVVAGPAVLDPFSGLETSVLGRTYDVVAACEEAAQGVLAEFGRRAEAVIADTIGPGEPAATVRVTRHDRATNVTISGLGTCRAEQRRAAVVRVVGLMRELDRSARTIDVGFDEPVT